MHVDGKTAGTYRDGRTKQRHVTRHCDETVYINQLVQASSFVMTEVTQVTMRGKLLREHLHIKFITLLVQQ